jgi:phage I-like protein
MTEVIKGLSIFLSVTSICFVSCQTRQLQNSRNSNQVASLKRPGTAATAKPDLTTVTCDDYATIKTEHGILTNNVWNKHAAGDNKWRQCIEER